MELKMIIVLDKICLMGVIGASLLIGYKAGVVATEVKFATNSMNKTGLHVVGEDNNES